MSLYRNMKSKLFLKQRPVTVTWLPSTEIPPVVQRRGGKPRESDCITGLKSAFNARLGPRSHNAKTGYTTMSKAKGIKPSHDTTGCVYVRKTEGERDRL